MISPTKRRGWHCAGGCVTVSPCVVTARLFLQRCCLVVLVIPRGPVSCETLWISAELGSQVSGTSCISVLIWGSLPRFGFLWLPWAKEQLPVEGSTAAA